MASKTASLTIRIDPQLRDTAEGVLEEVGMTISEAITIFLKQVVFTDGIPFRVKRPRYRPETIAACMDAPDTAKQNKGTYDVESFLQGLKDDAED
jgi:DNA-damage-inducible protein J